jgi:hypothetical protein
LKYQGLNLSWRECADVPKIICFLVDPVKEEVPAGQRTRFRRIGVSACGRIGERVNAYGLEAYACYISPFLTGTVY